MRGFAHHAVDHQPVLVRIDVRHARVVALEVQARRRDDAEQVLQRRERDRRMRRAREPGAFAALARSPRTSTARRTATRRIGAPSVLLHSGTFGGRFVVRPSRACAQRGRGRRERAAGQRGRAAQEAAPAASGGATSAVFRRRQDAARLRPRVARHRGAPRSARQRRVRVSARGEFEQLAAQRRPPRRCGPRSARTPCGRSRRTRDRRPGRRRRCRRCAGSTTPAWCSSARWRDTLVCVAPVAATIADDRLLARGRSCAGS